VLLSVFKTSYTTLPMNYRYLGSIAVAVLIIGLFWGENPSFPNKIIIKISGVFFWCALITLITNAY